METMQKWVTKQCWFHICLFVVLGLQEMFAQLDRYFMENKHSLHDRAPKHWMVPRLLDCTLCHQSDCVKPIIAEKKREINWLFLLLTQTLGLCTLDQLKFFCKHNDKHRTGAKDRVLYSTYGGLLKQLNPAGKYLPNDWFCILMMMFLWDLLFLLGLQIPSWSLQLGKAKKQNWWTRWAAQSFTLKSCSRPFLLSSRNQVVGKPSSCCQK